MDTAFVILPVLLFSDFLLIKKVGRDVFREVFSFHFLLTGALAVISVVLAAQIDGFDGAAVLALALVAAAHVLRRRKAMCVFAERGHYAPASPSYRFVLGIEAIGVIFQWFVGMIAVSVILRAAKSGWGHAMPLVFWILLLSFFGGLLMMGLIVIGARRFPGLDLKELLGLTVCHRHQRLMTWSAAAFAGAGLALVASTLLFFRQVQPATPFSEFLDMADSSGMAMMFLFVAVGVAPLLEEIFFRGYFYYVIDQIKGRGIAVLMSALIFTGMHLDQYAGDPLAVVIILVLGMVLTLFRAWSGSVWPSVIAHYFFNATMVVVPVILLGVFNPSYAEYLYRAEDLGPCEAKRLLEKSLEERPQNPEALYELAWYYMDEEGDFDRGLDAINQALVYVPGRSVYRLTQAEALLRLGRIAEAHAIFESMGREVPVDSGRDCADGQSEGLPK